MRKAVQWFSAGISVLVVCLLVVMAYVSVKLPDKLYIYEGEKLELPLPVSISEPNDKALYAGIDKVPGCSYNASLKIMDFIPVKTVNVGIVDETFVTPCGTPFGIKMFTEGVIVVGTGDIKTDSGYINPAHVAGIKVGDVILKMNNRSVTCNNDVGSIVRESGGTPIVTELKRKETTMTVNLRPVYSSADSEYKGGMWVRDSSAGIGTVTFYNQNTGIFGGLGHPICDISTGEIMPLMSGEVVDVNIMEVAKSSAGVPGELRGSFASQRLQGMLNLNCETGVYGTLFHNPANNTPIPVAHKQDVVPGPATIYTTLDNNGPQEYSIVIERVSLSDNNPTKNMTIRVTDSQLLAKTGGIVQGMSGSPIMQNGKLIGAVTHVFVNEPTKGYGIFAENMIETSELVKKSLRNAS